MYQAEDGEGVLFPEIFGSNNCVLLNSSKISLMSPTNTFKTFSRTSSQKQNKQKQKQKQKKSSIIIFVFVIL